MKGFCNVSVAPVRAEKSDRSEMVTQLLYGETLEVLETDDNWTKIKIQYDSYEGWMDSKQISNSVLPARGFVVNPYQDTETPEGDLLLSLGSEIPDGKLKELSRNSVRNLALQFLNVPYLWGGRSFFGIDCSGLAQIIYKVHGVKIPRDASQQALLGKDVTFTEEARPGDLAFFGKLKPNEEEDEIKITHVGLVLEHGQIIHAHGKVRIDQLDSVGIFNRDENRHTHKLRFIKNFID